MTCDTWFQTERELWSPVCDEDDQSRPREAQMAYYFFYLFIEQQQRALPVKCKALYVHTFICISVE